MPRSGLPHSAVSPLRDESFQLPKVLQHRSADCWKASCGCRVAGNQVRPAMPFDETAVAGTHGNPLVQHSETGDPFEQHDNPWMDDVELTSEVDGAVSDVGRGWCASGPAALDRTGEIDLSFVQTDALNRTAEPLAGPPDKWPPRLGLVPAGRFTHEDNEGAGAALTNDDFADTTPPAPPTGFDLAGNPPKSRARVGGRCPRASNCAIRCTTHHALRRPPGTDMESITSC